MPVSGTDRLGPYEIVRPISSGGMGEVSDMAPLEPEVFSDLPYDP